MRFFIAFLFTTLSFIAHADGPVNADSKGLFLSGYDVVSYFTEDKPDQGKERFSAQWQGVSLWFKTEANLNLFLASPESYWPQFAGHCANGLSDGHLVKANPEIYRIIDNQLYLFFSWWGKAQWKYDQQEQIQLANETWQAVLEANER